MGLLSNLTLFLAAVSAVVADATPNAAAAVPKITSITFSGNGCLKDPNFSGTFSDPKLTFQNFAAALPGNNKTVNCQAHLQATGASPGWQVAVKSNTVRGYAVLQPGTTLSHLTTVFFSQNPSNTDVLRDSITNTGDKTLSKAVVLTGKPDGALVWSPCIGSDGYTGILNVNFRAVLSGEGRAFFQANTEEWEVEWRKC